MKSGDVEQPLSGDRRVFGGPDFEATELEHLEQRSCQGRDARVV